MTAKRDRQPVSVTLSAEAIAAAKSRAGGRSMSRYLEQLIMADAVKDSVRQHAEWEAGRPGYWDADEAERVAAAGEAA